MLRNSFPSAHRTSRIQQLLAAVAGLLALYVVVSTASTVWNYRSPTPVGDHWDTIVDVRDYFKGDLTPAKFHRQHNDHRVTAGKLVFMADYLYFGGLGDLVFIAYGLLLGAFAGICAGWLWRRPGLGAARWTGSFAIATLAFGLYQTETLAMPFQLTFVMPLCAATLALYLLDRAIKSASTGLAVLALLVSLVPSLNVASGLLIVPLLFAVCIANRAPARFHALTALACAANLALFFWGYHSSPSFSAPKDLSFPLRYAHFLLCLLGDPAYVFGTRAAFALGCVFVLALLVIACNLQRRPATLAALAFPLGLLGYGIATAAIIAFGRCGLGPEYALVTRYISGVNAAWAGLILCLLATGGVASSASRLGIAIALLLTGLVAYSQRATEGNYRDMVNQANLTGDALITRTYMDPDTFFLVYAWLDLDNALRAHRLAHYHSDKVELLGKSLSQLGLQPDTKCRGFIDRVLPIATQPRHRRVEGWMYQRGAAPAAEILLLDENDVVAGLATTGWSRPDVAKVLGQDEARTGWRGYFVGDHGAVIKSALRDPRKGTVCVFATAPYAATEAAPQ